MEWAARAIGVFYLLGGLMLLYQAWTNWRLQRTLPRFLSPTPAERAADGIIAVGGVMVLVSGAALALLSSWAVLAFLAGWAIQAGYLIWAARCHRPREAVADHGRRRSVDAFAAYTMATAAVLCLPMMGILV
jgi:hypothetical protein